MKQATEILELVLKIFAVIGGLVGAFIFLRKWYKSLVAKREKYFSHSWSNEGNIDDQNVTHYIDLSIRCVGDKVSGSLNVNTIGSDENWKAVSLIGKITFHRAVCDIMHVRQGRVSNYGKVIIRKAKGGKLTWKLQDGLADFSPEKAILYPCLPVII